MKKWVSGLSLMAVLVLSVAPFAAAGINPDSCGGTPAQLCYLKR